MMNTFGWSVVFMSLTLCQFFEQTFMPLWVRGKNLDAKTESSYRQTLAHWSRITNDPELTDITDLMCANFAWQLGETKGKIGPKMAAQSIQKHLRQLCTILKLAGPRSQSNPSGQRIIVDVPYVPFSKSEDHGPGKPFKIDELRAMYTAADGMQRPCIEGVKPSEWWKSFLVVGWYTGLRIYALTHIEFSNIDGDWLDVPGAISKGGKSHRQYVHPEAMSHINRIRTDRAIIFEVPNFKTQKRYLYDWIKHLQKLVGIPEEKYRTFHAIRRGHCSELAGLSLASNQDLEAAQRSANHANSKITRDHYIDLDVQEKLIVSRINQMRSPVPRLEVVAPRAEPIAKPEKVEIRTDAWSVWKERFGSGNTVS